MNTLVLLLENVPILGHIISLVHFLCISRCHAERAGIKATIGLFTFPVNIIVEMIDSWRKSESFRIESSNLKSRSKWMKKYKSRRINQLFLPGSHQSASYAYKRKLRNKPMLSGWSKCQFHPLHKQLDAGIRFLEFQLLSHKENKEIWIHYDGILCIQFKTTLICIKEFLVKCPSEIIGIHLSCGDEIVDWLSVSSLISAHLGNYLIPEQMHNMKIGDITDYKRNIILFGNEQIPMKWNNLQLLNENYSASPHQMQNELFAMADSVLGANTSSLYWYKAVCIPSRFSIMRAYGGLIGFLYSKIQKEIFHFQEDFASHVNYFVKGVLQELIISPFTIMSIDYVHDDIINLIIMQNDQPSTRDTHSSQSSICSNLSDRNLVNFIKNNSGGFIERQPLLVNGNLSELSYNKFTSEVSINTGKKTSVISKSDNFLIKSNTDGLLEIVDEESELACENESNSQNGGLLQVWTSNL